MFPWVLCLLGLSVMVGRGSWSRAKDMVNGRVVTKAVDEMWTYLFRNAWAFLQVVFHVFCLY
ncbi:hypothetical protein HNQ62_002676 [Sulfurisphaera ohwakuensis]|uniref:Uncharacterized protein n=1 Tax=Sulfurisphaera ohwakuensis TaxID=69656 RepID=A0A7J9RXC4_SULOH|nr:hypothetical protein [Sulfurisphaera ohwakuensis]